MKILDQYTHDRDGNECRLSDYFAVIEFENKFAHRVYSVIHVDAVNGSWTGNIANLFGEAFTDYSSAKNYFKKLIRNYQ